MPVEVHHRLLKSQQVIDSDNDNVHGGRVAGLCAQVVLEIQVVAFAQQLNEAEQRARELLQQL